MLVHKAMHTFNVKIRRPLIGGLVVAAAALAGCGGSEDAAPGPGHDGRSAVPRPGGAGESGRGDLPVHRGRRRRRPGQPQGLRPFRRCRRRADVDRRPRSADPDLGVEARPDRRIQPDGLRARLSLRGPGQGHRRAVRHRLRRAGEALGHRGRRPRLRGGPARAAAPDREHLPHLQGRLARRRDRRRQLDGGVAVDQEGGHHHLPEPAPRRRPLFPGRQPRQGGDRGPPGRDPARRPGPADRGPQGR